MAVNIDKHSNRFVAAMRESGFEVTYDTVPEAVCRLHSMIEAEKCVMARNYNFVKEEFIK